MNKLNQIIGLMLELAEIERHPDKVACLYTVLMNVNIAVGKEMLKLREAERDRRTKI